MYAEENFDRPQEFLPERWLVDNEQLAKLKRSFLPFSLGVRACPGIK